MVGSEIEEARQVYKRCKSGFYESIEEMEPRELGLLYLYYPWTLPECDPSEATE